MDETRPGSGAEPRDEDGGRARARPDDGPQERDFDEPDRPPRPVFQHPEWTVGLVLVFAVVSILLGLANPLFFIIGGPFILVLILWVGVRLYSTWQRGRDPERHRSS